MKNKLTTLTFATFFLMGALIMQSSDWQDTMKAPKASVAWAAEKKLRAPDTHFIATPHEVVEIMIRLADVKETDVVYDLGCGDGRIVIAAAKKAGCKAYGFDLDPRMVEISKENIKKENLEAFVTIEQQDIFDLDLSNVSVVALYLFPELNVALIPQLEKMKPGSRIVAHDYGIDGVAQDVTANVHRKDGKSYKIFLYTTPLKQSPAHVFQKLFGKDKKSK
jgi:SAM-dependent methyltransferase